MSKRYSYASTLIVVAAVAPFAVGPMTPANEKPATAVAATARQAERTSAKRRIGLVNPFTRNTKSKTHQMKNRGQCSSVKTTGGGLCGRPRFPYRFLIFG